MVKGKQRLVKNLYNATPALSQPQVSPILQGSFRMQGPVDESDHQVRANMMPKEYSSCSENSKYHHRPESGTCNTCSTPSSSCSHNQILMASKVDECSGEASSALSYSVNCEGSCRNSDLSATSEIVTVLPKLGDLKVEGEHRDHQSCVTGIADSRMSHFTCNGDNTKTSNYPVSANTSSAQESVSMAPFSASSAAALSSHDSGHSDTVRDAIDKSNAEGNLLHFVTSSGLTSEVSKENLCHPLHSELLKNSQGVASSSSKGEESVSVQTDSLIQDLKVLENAESSKVKESSLESHPMEEGDDSDLVLQDVKVCDICGDAGREDLLAICSRCSDGAEHTYCMRERMDKVPSGDWLCEECQFGVQIKGRSPDETSVKMPSSGQANSGSSSGNKKSLAKASDVDEDRIGNGPTTRILGKRQANDVEVSIPAKRRVLESDKGSINLSTNSVVPAISRNGSFKLDRLKTKSSQNSSSSSLALPESASASRLHTQGSFIKSNSFNSLNVKPKVNRFDDVPQKQRSSRDSASLDRKEGALRSIRKSVSFKSPNMGRLNPGESKVKLLSHVPETKGSKNSKDRAMYERKNSFQSERPPMVNSAGPAAKNEQRLASSVEANSLYSSRVSRDSKAVASDGRSMLLSKSSSFAARRGSETSSLDNANGSFPDGVSQQKEPLDFGEKAKDSISERSKQSREGLESKDKLKAAIEAAVLKKPGIYRKYRRPDQGNDTSLASLNSENAGQVPLSDSNIKGIVTISSEMKEDHMAEIDGMKQFPGFSSEGSNLKTAESFPVVPLAIPDVEDIWKGVFEVHSVGRTINLFDGIQAHLSDCASPKVLEAVNKFDQRVILNEVPRLTTWPVQFQENGVTEGNIAMFFFAKDSTSYEKSYKVLLNNLMKNDFALIGNFDGFELLIFPSNQLPEKSQRWNTLFFMWGVFRGKRVNKHVLGSDEESLAPQGVPTASISFPFNRSSDMEGDVGISAGSIGCPASETRTSELTGEELTLKEGSDGRICSDVVNNDPVRTEQQLSLRPFSAMQGSTARSYGETADNNERLRPSIISMEEKGHGGCGNKAEVEVCGESTDRGGGSNESQQIAVECRPDLNSPLEQEQPCSMLEGGERFFFPVVPVAEEEAGKRKEVKMSSESKSPNLELALWARKDGLNLNEAAEEEEVAAAATNGGGDDDLPAALSLSLSFPFPDAEAPPPVSRPSEQEVSTSLLLFGQVSTSPTLHHPRFI